LPVIALFAFLLADVSIEETQTAQDLEAIQSAMDGQPTSAAGTGEEPEDGKPAEPEFGEDGEPVKPELGEDGAPVKPELGEDGEPVKPELGEDGEPVKPELGEDGEPVKPELGEDGEPVKPELGEDGEPVKPEPGDGEPQPAGPDGETPATPEEGDGTADAGDPSDGPPQGGKPEDGKPSDGEAQGGDPPQDGEAQPQDGEPQDGEPQDGEPQDGEPQDGEPQEDEADTPPPKEQPDLEDEPSESPKPKNNPVAVLLLGDDYTPLNGYFYLRQEVQSQFVGTRLVPAERTDVDLDIIEGFPTGPTDVTEPTPEEGHKVVHGKVAILADHTAPFGLDAPVSYAPAYNPNPARFLRAWTFVAHAPITPYEELIGHTSGAAWQEDVRDYYLAYPEDDPRYLELVETLVEGLRPEMQDDPFAKALVIKQHLDQMAYDTSERHAGATDPTAEFLFEGDEMVGYCVHAAHAATYLLRAAGVPARVGTGYAVEEERRRGSSIVVMGKDAHAWPELYLDDVGWTIVDIAPAENRDPEAEPIDEEFNDLLSDMAREEPDSEEVASYDWRGLWHSTLRTLRNAAVALAAFVIVLHYLVKLWRRTRPYLATHRGIARVGYRAAIDRLVEAGHVRETGETRERFARRIAGDVPTFKALTDLHVQAKLGHPDAEGPRSTSTWLRMLGQLNREIAASSGWSRWIAVANPFSFYRSR
ncbi:MAG: hypothetical protein KC912_26800, partial [Proteobacteria bacterium]|nr:hypothetical protein [Pseudomonadota bacterium]